MASNPKKNRLIRDLVSSIEDEANPFDMSAFVDLPDDEELNEYGEPLDPSPPRVTCGTASCIAGHLWAVRPGLARRYAASAGDFWSYDGVADDIWRHETGEAFCPLDFFGLRNKKNLSLITREEAIDHVRGVSETWPQLASKSVRV
jgi:hypothetical protein